MKNKYILIITILIIVAGAGFYAWRDLNKLPPPLIQGAPLDSENSSNLGQISEKMPDLDRDFYFKDSLPSDVKEIYISKINTTIDEIKENADFIDNWLVLGVYLKAIGDYSAAEDMWQYAGVLRPLNSTSFANLGNLYTYELKDYQKAEVNFKKALANDPSKIYIYTNFYELYKYGMKDDAKAKAILEEGIASNPDTSDDLKSLFSMPIQGVPLD
ncbi:MAG: hypothetical protein NUV64_00350 [Parcubacteria group bacterium]|nr:hypothetical protein [Parcubacteria group bacterium]MCR4342496.1 hypothetical protein [Patescibacteria group bacterium]